MPVWHDARRELPFVFAGGAAASAGAAALLVTSSQDARPARRVAMAGALLESVATQAMEKRLGKFIGEPYHDGKAGRAEKIARGCTMAGSAVVTVGGGKRLGAMAGGALLLTGSMMQRWAVYEAGMQSARDPKYTIVPQRQRLEDGSRSKTVRS